MKTAQYLDAVKRTLGIESDYALAKHLKIGHSRISNWRAGRSLPDTLTIVRLAEILAEGSRLEGQMLQRILADIELERASKPRERELWKRIRDAAIVATMALGATLGAPAPAHAGVLHNYFSPSSGPLYALPPKRRRGLAHWLDVLLGR